MRAYSRKRTTTALSVKERHDSALTVRQQEVLSLLADGRSNKEIAETLFVTPGTVKSHISRLCDRFGKHTRTELAVLWTEKVQKATSDQ